MDQTADEAARRAEWNGSVEEVARNGDAAGAAQALDDRPEHSKRSIFWILGGLLVFGAVAVYKWWRGLPR